MKMEHYSTTSAAARASIVHTHIRCRSTVTCRCRCASLCSHWSPRRCWWRKGDKDPVTLLAEGPEEGAAIVLQALVHEVCAILNLMSPCECPQVMLSPTVKAIYADQCFGDTCSHITFQCRYPLWAKVLETCDAYEQGGNTVLPLLEF